MGTLLRTYNRTCDLVYFFGYNPASCKGSSSGSKKWVIDLQLYTKTGDDGTTGLGDGSRTAKRYRIEAVGTIDELNSWIGLLIADLPDDEVLTGSLTEIQHRLFDLGGELAVPGFQLITKEMVSDLEALCDGLNGTLPPLKEFILPGGPRAEFLAWRERWRKR